MKHTVVAVFDLAEDARKAARDLKARGFEGSAVHVTLAPDTNVPPAAQIEAGPLSGLMHRLSVLFGVDEPHLGHYEEAVRRGGSVVQVEAADEAQATTARDALLAAGAANIDDRVAEWERQGWRGDEQGTGGTGSAPGSAVHRDTVSAGGVRVYGHTVLVAFDDLADGLRADWEAHYAVLGMTYAEIEPAYRHGHALASDARNSGRSWDEVEPEARAAWEQGEPQTAWERVANAVRHGWERATRRSPRS